MKINVKDISNKFAYFRSDSNKSVLQNKTLIKSNKPKRKSIAFLMALHDPNPIQQQIRCSLGISTEDENINKYETKFNTKVIQRNEELLEVNIHGTTITGRIDGKTEKNILIEHKRRTNGLLSHVPIHERVQCHLYMYMINSVITHLVETFGEHMQVHVIYFDNVLWENILMRINSIESN